MTITEKAAYLRGFADAAKLDSDKDSDKLLLKIVEIIDDLALCVTDLDDQMAEANDRMDALDEDLSDVEEVVWDDDCDCCDDDCDCCDCDDDDLMFELECPACGETIYLDDSIFDSDEEITCPACGAVLEDLTIEEDGEEDE